MKRITVIIAVALIIILLAACGGAYGGTGSAPTSETTAAATGTTSPAAGGATGSVVQVIMKNISFNPANVTIKAGDTVEWVNDDSTTHNVTGPDWESGKMAPGATFKKQFAQAGKIDYHCSIHPSMTGTITVE